MQPYLSTRSSKHHTVVHGSGIDSRDRTLINIGFTVQSQTGDAAFLVPGGESRRVETFYTVRQFERYLADNYTAIAERFSDHPNLDTLMILRGTTYTDGYCRGLLQQSHRKAAGMLTLSPLGLEMFSLEMGGNRSVIGHVRIVVAMQLCY